MKTVKFTPDLAQLILDGKKTTTWRLFDDKDLQAGDDIELMNKATGVAFARGVISSVVEKPLKDLDDADWEGHERFPSDEAMYAEYRGYYPGREVGPDTVVKILHFDLIKSSSDYCTFYIVRHGETEGNKKGIVMGHHDAPLTPEGEQQVRDTAERLKHVHFDAIFSSDLPRTQRTAGIIRLNRELAIQTSAMLRERNFGPFEGRPSAEYHEAIKDLLVKKETLLEKEQWTFGFGEGVETDEELVTRFIAQLREIAVAYPGKTVLVASHGGCIRTFLVRTGWTHYAGLPGGSFRNGGYVRALSDGVDFIIKDVEGVRPAAGSE